jgi:hypothetical protein
MSKDIELRDIKVFFKREVEGKTVAKVAEEIGVSTDTIKRIRKKPAYRDLTLDALQEQGYSVNNLIKDLIRQTNATKHIIQNGRVVETDDNIAQIAAIKKLSEIFGVDAPKEQNIHHSFASSSDGELAGELEAAFSVFGLAVVDRQDGKQDTGAGDSPALEGAVLSVPAIQ